MRAAKDVECFLEIAIVRQRSPKAGEKRPVIGIGDRRFLEYGDVKGSKASREKAFFVGAYGRMRTVVRAPDGNLWVTTSNRDGRGSPADEDDRILLVRP